MHRGVIAQASCVTTWGSVKDRVSEVCSADYVSKLGPRNALRVKLVDAMLGIAPICHQIREHIGNPKLAETMKVFSDAPVTELADTLPADNMFDSDVWMWFWGLPGCVCWGGRALTSARVTAKTQHQQHQSLQQNNFSSSSSGGTSSCGSRGTAAAAAAAEVDLFIVFV
jgi:hypothetical protein